MRTGGPGGVAAVVSGAAVDVVNEPVVGGDDVALALGAEAVVLSVLELLEPQPASTVATRKTAKAKRVLRLMAPTTPPNVALASIASIILRMALSLLERNGFVCPGPERRA